MYDTHIVKYLNFVLNVVSLYEINYNKSMKKIFLVEDDATIVLGLSYSLESEGFKVISCATVNDAKALLSDQQFDLAILDLTLPDGSGYEVCKIARAKHIPVIFLTACDDEVNVVMGLDMGADDYIAKPFRLRELISRIKTVLRRNERGFENAYIYTIGALVINTAAGKVYRNNVDTMLTALEYRLLLALINHDGQILSRSQLLEEIWDVGGDFVNDNTLTVYIKRLREKIEDDPIHPEIIETVRGMGYMVRLKRS